MRLFCSGTSAGLAILVVAVFAVAQPAWSAELAGRVVGVTDGDTVTVLTVERLPEKIRLAGIDAPEKSQPYGQASKEALSALVYGRMVFVDWAKRDRYGRIVGKMLIENRDANLEQLRMGMAWHYKKYAAEQAPEDRVAYALAEETARQSRAGLWADGDAAPPWEWRKAK